jgi:hypothetical protein
MMVARRQRADGETTEPHTIGYWLRAIGVLLLLVVASVAFTGYVAVRWMEKEVLNTNHWIAMVGPLPKEPVVSDALGKYIGLQVFDQPSVESRITEALPPRADFLAGPLAGQLQTVTVTASQRLVASDAFQSIWEGANRVAMNRLLATARGQTPPLQARVNERFDVNLSEAGGNLRGALGKVSTAIPALQPASQKAIDLSTDLKARPTKVHQAIRTADTLYAVLPLVVVAAFLAALAMSHRRRRTIILAATLAIVLLLVELIALKWFRGYAIDQVRKAENVPAISHVYDVVTAGLRNAFIQALVVSGVLLALAWVSGTTSFRQRLHSMAATDRLRDSQAASWWGPTRAWFGKWEFALWIGIVVAVLIGLAAHQQVNGRGILNAVLLTVSLWALVHIVAHPRRLPAKHSTA